MTQIAEAERWHIPKSMRVLLDQEIATRSRLGIDYGSVEQLASELVLAQLAQLHNARAPKPAPYTFVHTVKMWRKP